MIDIMTQENDEVAAIVLDQAARLFQGEVTRQLLADADEGAWQQALWQQVAAAGLQLALVPEADGGAGLSLSVGLAVMRQAAQYALPLPLGETMLAHALWAAAGGELADDVHEQPATLAPESGSENGGLRMTLRRDADGWQLSGALQGVPWPEQSSFVLLCAREEGAQTMLVRLPCAGLPWALDANLAHEPRGNCTLDGHAVAAADVRPAPLDLRDAGLQPHGALLRAWQLSGAMQRCFDLALAYSRERVQFGKTISAYTPVQTMLVEMAGHIAAASVACEGAAKMAGEDFLRAVAVAKSRAGEAAGVVAAHAHQVHGAIGYTQDHGLHHSTRRLWSWRDEFGSEAHWNRRLGAAVCAQGGAALWRALVRSA